MNFDDQFWKDIIKIVLDKGLLALILLIFSFFISRSLEKFKSKLAHRQVISGHRLKAYNELLEALLNHNVARQKFLRTLYMIHASKKLSERLKETDYLRVGDWNLEDDFKNNAANFASTFFHINEVMKGNMVFISPELIEVLGKYFELLEINDITKSDKIDYFIEVLSNVEVYKFFFTAQQILLDEIHGK